MAHLMAHLIVPCVSKKQVDDGLKVPISCTECGGVDPESRLTRSILTACVEHWL